MLIVRNWSYISKKVQTMVNNKLKEVVSKDIKKIFRKTFSRRWLFELRTWELSQKLKCKEIFVFQFWCFFIYVCTDKDKVHSGKTWLICWACVFSIFKCLIYKTANKQCMTPTFGVDVSPAFYSKCKFSWKLCQTLWSKLKLTESSKYIFKAKERKLRVSLHFQ